MSVNVFVHHTCCTLEVVNHWTLISSLWSSKFILLPFKIKCSKILNENRKNTEKKKIEQFYLSIFLIKKKVFPRVIRKTFTVRDLVKCSLSDIHRLIQQKGFTLKQTNKKKKTIPGITILLYYRGKHNHGNTTLK